MANALTLLHSGMRNERSPLAPRLRAHSSVARFCPSTHTCLTHTRANMKTVMSACSHCCHGDIHAHVTMLFHSVPLFVFVMLFDAVFFLLLRFFLFIVLQPLSLCATHSLAVFLSFFRSLLTVKPFQGPLVVEHQKLSCQMHRGR